MSRMRAKGRKPEFYYVASGNGRKMPDLNRQPEMYRKNKEAKKEEIKTEQKILPPSQPIEPEVVIPESPKKELTLIEKMALIKELEGKITFWKNRPCQGHPKMWAVTRDAAISEIQDKINQLRNPNQ